LNSVDSCQDTKKHFHPAWGAVFSMALGVVVLISSEFLPVSLLTPLSDGLNISQGQAGQAISVSGFFAVLTSLLNVPLTGHIDRKKVLVGFTLLLTISGLVVSFAMNGFLFMVGRALLGIAIGGFWSMSTATVMRLLPTHAIAKGLAVINGGNALAATVAAPLGSFLGQYIGWRGAFFMVVPFAVIAFIWQWRTIPHLPVKFSPDKAINPLRLLLLPRVSLGMSGIMFLFMGQFSIFTYLRPFLEVVTKTSIDVLSFILLLMGAFGLIGTWLIGKFLSHRLYTCLISIPLLMSLIGILLIAMGHSKWGVGTLLAIWGLISTPAPVAWGLWLSRSMPNNAESGGGLMVAVIQLSITLGASVGGILLDKAGWWSPFAFGVIALLLSSFFAGLSSKQHSKNQDGDTHVSS